MKKMTRSKLPILFSMFLFLAIFTSAQTKARFPAHLKAVTAKLYFDESGTFSDDILSKPDLGLWNTIIGEGGAGSPSTETLITVEVVGDGGPNVYGADTLDITIQQGKRPAIKRHLEHLHFSKDGKYFTSVMLDDTGCEQVSITAQVNKQAPVQKKIPFECGE